MRKKRQCGALVCGIVHPNVCYTLPGQMAAGPRQSKVPYSFNICPECPQIRASCLCNTSRRHWPAFCLKTGICAQPSGRESFQTRKRCRSDSLSIIWFVVLHLCTRISLAAGGQHWCWFVRVCVCGTAPTLRSGVAGHPFRLQRGRGELSGALRGACTPNAGTGAANSEKMTHPHTHAHTSTHFCRHPQRRQHGRR